MFEQNVSIVSVADLKALLDARQENKEKTEKRIDILEVLLCETCNNCGDECHSPPDAKVNGCLDYKKKLSAVMSDALKPKPTNVLCLTCLMRTNCSIPMTTSEPIEKCNYYRTDASDSKDLVSSQNLKPAICQTCMFKGRSCIPNHGEDCSEFKQKQTNDNVNHPQHYTQGGIECLDAIEAAMKPDQFRGYLKGNIIKYLWRYEWKNGLEDLKKAQFYMNRMVASKEKEDGKENF